jgi:hypothetical protein
MDLSPPAKIIEEDDSWAQARTYAEVLDLNRRFLRGNLVYAPTHGGSIDEKILPLVPGLLEMHDYGFLTTNSHPSSRKITQGHELGSRGCAVFLVPQKDKIPQALVTAFCDRLFQMHQIIVTVRDEDGEVRRSNQTTEEINLWGSLDPHNPRPRIWETILTLDPMEDIELIQAEGCVAITAVHPLQIIVATRHFNAGFSLEEFIINCARDCGLDPVYKYSNTRQYWIISSPTQGQQLSTLTWCPLEEIFGASNAGLLLEHLLIVSRHKQ